MAVTQILAGLAFPDRRFLALFGGARAMIESPVLDEVKEILKKRYESDGAAKATRQAIRVTLEARFGVVPAERVAALNAVSDHPLGPVGVIDETSTAEKSDRPPGSNAGTWGVWARSTTGS